MSGIKSYELVGIVIAASWILGSTVGKLRGPFSLSLSPQPFIPLDPTSNGRRAKVSSKSNHCRLTVDQ